MGYSRQPVKRNLHILVAALPACSKLHTRMPRDRPVTRERKDVTLPKGLYADVQQLLGGRGVSALVSTLLLKWKEQNSRKK